MLPFGRMLSYGNIAPPPPRIKKIEASELHCAFVYTNGNMYMRGVGSDYKLGTGTETNVLDKFIKVPFDVIDCWLGIYGTIILTRDMKLYMCGNTSYIGIPGVYRTWTEITSSFTNINMSSIKNIKLTSSSAGDGTCLVLLKDGSLYGLGSNGFSVLGIPSTWITVPILIDTSVSNVVVQGARAAAFYIKNGVLYRCGNGASNVLGTSGANLTSYTALNISDKVLDVVTTFKCTKIITVSSDGVFSMYIAGDNSDAQFGTGQQTTIKNPTFVRYNTIQNIQLDSSSFLRSTGFLNSIKSNGVVYSTGGSNSSGFGLGRPVTSITDRLSYFPIQFVEPIDYSSSTIDYVSQGSSGLSYILLNQEDIYWCGNKGYYTEQSSGSGNQDQFIKMILPE